MMMSLQFVFSVIFCRSFLLAYFISYYRILLLIVVLGFINSYHRNSYLCSSLTIFFICLFSYVFLYSSVNKIVSQRCSSYRKVFFLSLCVIFRSP